MKRDFEKEFRELKLGEVPDLWNRIEAGLSDKKIAASVSENAMADSNVYKFGKGSIWRRWGTIAAACLCVAIILPALSLVLGNLGGRKNNYSGSATNSADGNAADIASSDMGNASENITSNEMNGSVENMADMSEMIVGAEVTEDSDVTIESETTDMSGAEESRNALDSQNSMKNLQSADNAGIADAAASKTEKAMSDSAEAADDSITNDFAYSPELEDGQVLNGVVVEILESSVSGKDTVYKAVVKQQDDDGLLNRDQEISFICNSETEYKFTAVQSKKLALKEKERYEVSLRYEKNNNKTGQSADSPESGRFVAIGVVPEI